MVLKQGGAAFIYKGFCNWKDATVGMKIHELSACHKTVMEIMVVLPSSYKDVGEQLSQQHANEKRDNRQCLLNILSNLRFLARQGIALRGDSQEVDSNFIQLLKLRGEEDPRINSWLGHKTDRYTSHDMQNELLKVMALSILRDLSGRINRSTFFCIMYDKCTDASNREQVVICIRWINNELEPQEDFLGLYKVGDICTSTIVAVIKDTLVRMYLSLSKCRGQCYDGASTMKGAKTGVAKQLCDEEKRAIYMHCYGHALNLAAGDSIQNSKLMKDALETTGFKKRDVKIEKLKENLAPDNPGFRVLCPTRWTVTADSIKSVLDNYTVLQKLWE